MAKRKRTIMDDMPGLFDEVVPASTPAEAADPKPAEPLRVSFGAETPTPPPVPKTEPVSDSTSAEAKAAATAAPAEAAPKAAESVEYQPNSGIRYISFGSGSSGNCAYLGNERFGLLIDAGVEPDRIFEKLLRYGISPESIGGIILTHDHGDHIRYAYNIVRKYRHMRIYCTPRTLTGILRRHNVSSRIKDYHQPIFKEFEFRLADFTITPFETSHDGTDNVGFSIAYGDVNFVVATDMGTVTERADFYIRRANHLMIETNYDLTMLMDGTYPEYLKARIISARGHMDNMATAKYLAEIYTPRLRNIFLCHLSHDNNTPRLALDAVVNALRAKGLTVGDASGSVATRSADVQVMALPRFDITNLFNLR